MVRKKKKNASESSDFQSDTDSGEDDLDEEEIKSRESQQSEESDDSSAEDGNFSDCRVCGSGAGDLLCCETCPNVYHLFCTDPPLEVLPRGKWTCPECRELQALQDIERILSSTRASTSGQLERYEMDEYGVPHGRGVVVKWKEMSYIHASVIPMHMLVAAQKLFSSSLGPKVKKFLQEEEWREHQREQHTKAGLELSWPTAIDPSWLTISRVLHEYRPTHGSKGPQMSYHRPLFEAGTSFLVKWAGLPYQDCTEEEGYDCIECTGKEDFARIVSKYRIQASIVKSPFSTRVDAALVTEGLAKDKETSGQTYSVSPKFLAGELHGYQLQGLNWLLHAKEQQNHVILADEMGLGKTIQAIAYQMTTLAQGAVKPHLVVVPLTTLHNWERELEMWAPDLNTVVFYGNQAGRDTIKEFELYTDDGARQDDIKFHVMLTSYETAGIEVSLLRKIEWESMIVDEGHRLKNKSSRLFTVLQQLKASHKILLTGTPLQNNIAELFMLLHFLDNGKFGNLEEFEAHFKDLSHEDQVSELHSKLKPHLLRRLKRDVLGSLPPKREQIVRVELSALQKHMYRQILTQNFATLATNSKQKSSTSLGNILMDLRKCCNHPYLIRGTEADYLSGRSINTADRSAVLDALLEAGGKLQLLDQMMKKLIERGHRVLIYSQFTSMLDVLEDWLLERRWGYKRLDGDVSTALRQRSIDEFNGSPEKFCCFLLSTRAGGLGINLTTADTVITYDSDWNPHNDLQAHARVHRLGQEKPVMIYRLVTRATIEERMMQQAKEKLVLEHLVVQGMSGKSQLRQQDLDDLLRYGAAELFNDTNHQPPGNGTKAVVSPTIAQASPAKKRVGMADAEQEAGRTGGDAGTQILYDDAALDRLLDRSNVADDASQDLPESDFMKAFKVASFETTEKAHHVTAKSADNKSFWETLLSNSAEQDKQAELNRLGKGMRERRQVNYNDDAAVFASDTRGAKRQKVASEDESKDWSSVVEESSSSDDDWDVELSLPKKSVPKSSAKPVPVSQPADAEPSLLGFNPQERKEFIKQLMAFGVHQVSTETGEQAFMWSHMAAFFPSKTPAEIQAFGDLIITCLTEPAIIPQGLTRQSIYGDTTPEILLVRLSALLQLKKFCYSPIAAQMSFLHSPLCATLPKYATWKPNHDILILVRVHKHGYGNWDAVLDEDDFDIKPSLPPAIGPGPDPDAYKDDPKLLREEQLKHRRRIISFLYRRVELILHLLMNITGRKTPVTNQQATPQSSMPQTQGPVRLIGLGQTPVASQLIASPSQTFHPRPAVTQAAAQEGAAGRPQEARPQAGGALSPGLTPTAVWQPQVARPQVARPQAVEALRPAMTQPTSAAAVHLTAGQAHVGRPMEAGVVRPSIAAMARPSIAQASSRVAGTNAAQRSSNIAPSCQPHLARLPALGQQHRAGVVSAVQGRYIGQSSISPTGRGISITTGAGVQVFAAQGQPRQMTGHPQSISASQQPISQQTPTPTQYGAKPQAQQPANQQRVGTANWLVQGARTAEMQGLRTAGVERPRVGSVHGSVQAMQQAGSQQGLRIAGAERQGASQLAQRQVSPMPQIGHPYGDQAIVQPSSRARTAAQIAVPSGQQNSANAQYRSSSFAMGYPVQPEHAAGVAQPGSAPSSMLLNSSMHSRPAAVQPQQGLETQASQPFGSQFSNLQASASLRQTGAESGGASQAAQDFAVGVPEQLEVSARQAMTELDGRLETMLTNIGVPYQTRPPNHQPQAGPAVRHGVPAHAASQMLEIRQPKPVPLSMPVGNNPPPASSNVGAIRGQQPIAAIAMVATPSQRPYQQTPSQTLASQPSQPVARPNAAQLTRAQRVQLYLLAQKMGHTAVPGTYSSLSTAQGQTERPRLFSSEPQTPIVSLAHPVRPASTGVSQAPSQDHAQVQRSGTQTAQGAIQGVQVQPSGTSLMAQPSQGDRQQSDLPDGRPTDPIGTDQENQRPASNLRPQLEWIGRELFRRAVASARARDPSLGPDHIPIVNGRAITERDLLEFYLAKQIDGLSHGSQLSSTQTTALVQGFSHQSQLTGIDQTARTQNPPVHVEQQAKTDCLPSGSPTVPQAGLAIQQMPQPPLQALRNANNLPSHAPALTQNKQPPVPSGGSTQAQKFAGLAGSNPSMLVEPHALQQRRTEQAAALMSVPPSDARVTQSLQREPSRAAPPHQPLASVPVSSSWQITRAVLGEAFALPSQLQSGASTPAHRYEEQRMAPPQAPYLTRASDSMPAPRIGQPNQIQLQQASAVHMQGSQPAVSQAQSVEGLSSRVPQIPQQSMEISDSTAPQNLQTYQTSSQITPEVQLQTPTTEQAGATEVPSSPQSSGPQSISPVEKLQLAMDAALAKQKERLKLGSSIQKDPAAEPGEESFASEQIQATSNAIEVANSDRPACQPLTDAAPVEQNTESHKAVPESTALNLGSAEEAQPGPSREQQVTAVQQRARTAAADQQSLGHADSRVTGVQLKQNPAGPGDNPTKKHGKKAARAKVTPAVVDNENHARLRAEANAYLAQLHDQRLKSKGNTFPWVTAAGTEKEHAAALNSQSKHLQTTMTAGEALQGKSSLGARQSDLADKGVNASVAVPETSRALPTDRHGMDQAMQSGSTTVPNAAALEAPIVASINAQTAKGASLDTKDNPARPQTQLHTTHKPSIRNHREQVDAPVASAAANVSTSNQALTSGEPAQQPSQLLPAANTRAGPLASMTGPEMVGKSQASQRSTPANPTLPPWIAQHSPSRVAQATGQARNELLPSSAQTVQPIDQRQLQHARETFVRNEPAWFAGMSIPEDGQKQHPMVSQSGKSPAAPSTEKSGPLGTSANLQNQQRDSPAHPQQNPAPTVQSQPVVLDLTEDVINLVSSDEE